MDLLLLHTSPPILLAAKKKRVMDVHVQVTHALILTDPNGHPALPTSSHPTLFSGTMQNSSVLSHREPGQPPSTSFTNQHDCLHCRLCDIVNICHPAAGEIDSLALYSHGASKLTHTVGSAEALPGSSACPPLQRERQPLSPPRD